MSHNSTDFRVIKNRQAIQAAMLALLERKRFDEISIRDLTNEATISRATFYRHYEDKYQLAEEMLDERIGKLASRFRVAAGVRGEPQAQWQHLFLHIAEFRGFYHALLGKNGSLLIRAYVQRLIMDIVRQQFIGSLVSPEQHRIPLEVSLQYIAEAFLGLMVWWLESDTAYSPEQMATWTMLLIMNGVSSGLT